MAQLTDVHGIGAAIAATLQREGIGTVQALAEAKADRIASIRGIGAKRAPAIIAAAQALLTMDTVARNSPLRRAAGSTNATPPAVTADIADVPEPTAKTKDAGKKKKKAKKSRADTKAPAKSEKARKKDKADKKAKAGKKAKADKKKKSDKKSKSGKASKNSA